MKAQEVKISTEQNVGLYIYGMGKVGQVKWWCIPLSAWFEAFLLHNDIPHTVVHSYNECTIRAEALAARGPGFIQV